jgi:hypothetical protein
MRTPPGGFSFYAKSPMRESRMTALETCFGLLTTVGVSGSRICDGHRYLLDRADKTELSECGDTIVEPYFFDDLAVLKTQHCRSGEVHFATRRSRQRP